MRQFAIFHRIMRAVVWASLGLPLAVFAQTYPVKPIRIVVPYPPGGVDLVIRLLVPSMEKTLGQPVIIDYRPGAGGLIGTEHVARSAPDGYTLLATVANSWINLPALRKQTPYDPIKDLTPVGLLMEGVSLIVAHPSFPANNMAELVAYAKRNPGKVVYATSGIGGSQHLEGETIQRLAAIDWVHAPFQGFGPMIPALTGGQVPVGFITYAVAKGFLATGKWKLIAVTNSDSVGRTMAPPGAQIVADVVPGFEAMPVWMAIGGPAGLPRPIVNRLNEAIAQAQREPNIVERYAEDKQVNIATTPEAFERRVRSDLEVVRKAIAAAGIPPQE
ncbi:MAG: Bug family tripartite tricarboxylate transporter substrate binding protein [Burkholderiales bacterium]